MAAPELRTAVVAERDGGHVIPGGRLHGILGRGTDRLVAADAIAEFFGLA